MKILVLNCGSSTLKFQLIEIAQGERPERKLARGLVDRLGADGSLSLRGGWGRSGGSGCHRVRRMKTPCAW